MIFVFLYLKFISIYYLLFIIYIYFFIQFYFHLLLLSLSHILISLLWLQFCIPKKSKIYYSTCTYSIESFPSQGSLRKKEYFEERSFLILFS